MTLVAGYYVYLAESVEGHCNEQAVAIMLLVSRAEYPAQSEVRKYLSGLSSQNWFPWLSQARTTAQREANSGPAPLSCEAWVAPLLGPLWPPRPQHSAAISCQDTPLRRSENRGFGLFGRWPELLRSEIQVLCRARAKSSQPC